MKIRIKQVRQLPNGKPGTDILLGKAKERVVLQFRPMDPSQPNEDHVCEVSDPDHVAQLLSIREGFEVHPSELAKGGAAAAAASAAASKSKGADASVLSDEELAAELERRRAANGGGADQAKAEISTADPGQGADELSKDELVKAVEKKTGKKPHPSTSVKKLREMLAAK